MIAMAAGTRTNYCVRPVVLDLDKTAAGTARAAVRERLAAHGLAADAAELVVSELVTNAVTAVLSMDQPDAPHVGLTITINRDQAGRPTSVSIDIWDACPRPPVYPPQKDPDPDAENGRGLQIVNALADVWGWSPVAQGGKTVWAILPAGREDET